MKKLVSLSLSLALCMSMLAGCGNNSASTASTAPGASGAAAADTGSAAETETNAAEGDLDTSKFLKIQDDNPDTVDPQCTTEYYTVAMNIFDRLVEVKANDDGTSGKELDCFRRRPHLYLHLERGREVLQRRRPHFL